MQCNTCIVSSGNRIELCFYCLNGAKFRPGDEVRIKNNNVIHHTGLIQKAQFLSGCYVVKFKHDSACHFVPEHILELVEKGEKSRCECGNPLNPQGQGHSDWCKLYKREF